jgi:hypothetical protein
MVKMGSKFELRAQKPQAQFFLWQLEMDGRSVYFWFGSVFIKTSNQTKFF